MIAQDLFVNFFFPHVFSVNVHGFRLSLPSRMEMNSPI